MTYVGVAIQGMALDVRAVASGADQAEVQKRTDEAVASLQPTQMGEGYVAYVLSLGDDHGPEQSKTHITQGNQVVFVALGTQVGTNHWIIPEQEVEQNITAADLPGADPHVKGQLWSNGGVVTISAG